MEIKSIVVGVMEENCYMLTDGGEAAVIDPGAEPDRIISEIESSGAALKMILLTHGHFDHIGAVSALAKYSSAAVYVHSADAVMLTDNTKNLSYMTGEKIEPYEADKQLSGGETLRLGGVQIKVHHTPGHSGGCVCFECGDNLFGGDLLFRGSIGKFDHVNLRTQMQSLKYLMDNFDDNVRVFPGHGLSTTIGEERRSNPYIVNHINWE